MGKRQYNDTKHKVLRFLDKMDVKAIVSILAMELGMFLFVAYKGYASFYFLVTVVLMAFSVIGCGFVFAIQADKYLLTVILILLNMGFMVQQIQAGASMQMLPFLLKFMVAIVTAVAVAAVYQHFADLLARDFMILILMEIQIAVSAVMLAFGQVVGDSEQSAAISLLHGVTPFEIVKILYVLVAAGLLCKPEKRTIAVGRLMVDRQVLLVIHTAVLAVLFILCSELGTLLIVLFSGLLLLWVYGENRKLSTALLLLSVSGFLVFWFVCDKVLYSMLLQEAITLPDVVKKVVLRFGTALHPEKAMADAGYQGTLGLEALSLGGLFGISSERYRLKLPEASNDYAFANVVQTCGMLMGMLMLLSFIALLRRGIKIADQCEDSYFQGLAAEITFMISVETVVHIGYNIGFLPITGIPLFFVSQGFTAVITGMALISILLVVSQKNRKGW